MSNPSRKNRLLRKQTKPLKQKIVSAAKQQSRKKIVLFALIAILAAIPFGLGKYFEFNSPGPYDSAAYVYSAKHILDGAEIGIDEKPSAQMGTLVVNILGVWLFGFNETGPKLLQTILQAAALVLMFIAMAKLFGALPAAVGVILASVYLSAPLIAKFGNVKEQYMIAFMVMAMSCFVLGQLGRRWWLILLAGGLLAWGPLFKPTGMSAIGAMGLFLIVQPFLRKRNWKQTAADIGLLTAGAVIAITPLYVWLISCHGGRNLPYSFLSKPILSAFKSPQHEPTEFQTNDSDARKKPEKKSLLAKLGGEYVSRSWQILKPGQKKEAAIRVLRYYLLLILPIALAIGTIVARLIRMIMHRLGKLRPGNKKDCDRFVLLFAVWWLLDMAFVWVSPRSYEQYYLPLNASAAMLGGYVIALYSYKLSSSVYKGKWGLFGAAGLVCMVIMSWHIFFGIERSPHSGADYGKKRRGYVQKLDEIAKRRKQGKVGAWEVVGEYIRRNSTQNDKIYVWGWVPGIYVKAQRFSPAARAFTSEMHVKPPQVLSEMVAELLTAFEKEPLKFIVDTHNRHFPYDGRPPLELWPVLQLQILRKSGIQTTEPDKAYAIWLTENVGPDEAERFKAMAPFRKFVMKNYKIVPQRFGANILFRLKNPPANKEPQ